LQNKSVKGCEALPGQLSLFAGAMTRPNGFRLEPEFISVDEERELVARIRELQLTPFHFGAVEGKRRVASFGWHHNYSLQQLEAAGEVPDRLLPFALRIDTFGRLPHGAIQQVLCTEYETGAGIGWHRDKPYFDQVFGSHLHRRASSVSGAGLVPNGSGRRSRSNRDRSIGFPASLGPTGRTASRRWTSGASPLHFGP
jgi:hypothetical protein